MRKFEVANDGAVLLDEICEMDYNMQSKLLRVLEEKEFERVGGNKSYPVKARIIASTNQNPKELVAKGQFRLDLYYRLNVLEVKIPPLRAHKADIPKLIEHFKRHDNLKLELSEDALDALLQYQWPGNVRELKNVLNRIHFVYPNTIITRQQINEITGEITDINESSTLNSFVSGLFQPAENQLDKESGSGMLTIAEQEKESIKKTLALCSYNMSKTASFLGISRSALYQKIYRYQIKVEKGLN